MNKETLEEAAKKYATNNTTEPITFDENAFCDFIEGAKWQKNNYVKYISQLENHSFVGWSEDSINGYLTACATLKDNI
jgi:hypothetical protein